MLYLLTFSNLSVLFCANPRIRAINAGGWIRLFVRSSSVKILLDSNISASATQPSNPNPFQDKLSLCNALLRCKKPPRWNYTFGTSKACSIVIWANLHATGLYIWLHSACVSTVKPLEISTAPVNRMQFHERSKISSELEAEKIS